MVNRSQITLLFFLILIISGCTHVISKDLIIKVDSSITFREVQQNPNEYKGKIVLWGGEIIQILPQEDGTTLIEVLLWPLGWRGEPQRTVAFQGKFLILVKEHLNSSLYEGRNKITVAGEIQGEIQGEKEKFVTDSTYRYPLVLSKQIHIWKEYYRPYPYYYYDPWWGYPYWWGGFGFYHHHHHHHH